MYREVAKGLDDVQGALRVLNRKMETLVKEGSATDVRLADWVEFFQSEKLLVVPKGSSRREEEEEEEEKGASSLTA